MNILNRFWIEFQGEDQEYTVEDIYLLDSEGDGKYASLLAYNMLRDMGVGGNLQMTWIHSEAKWVN